MSHHFRSPQVIENVSKEEISLCNEKCPAQRIFRNPASAAAIDSNHCNMSENQNRLLAFEFIAQQIMYSKATSIVFLTILCFCANAAAASAESEELKRYTEQAREIVSKLGQSLKTTLKQTLKKENTARAVETCHIKAPDIVADAGNHGWDVRRTSLKVRNLEDAPDKWEAAVLDDFAKRKAAGEPIAGMEFAQIITTDKGRRFRYMKAIGIRKVCLKCHGSDLRSDVLKQLDSLYPFDQATGFEPGDLRGAYSLSRILDE
ncbi:Tll0287-like domain-containing protein [Thiolapillus sp.]